VMISPAPPTALLPRCARCQSLAKPSVAEYWHMGDITILLRSVTLLIVNGEKSIDMIFLFSIKILFTKVVIYLFLFSDIHKNHKSY
jgi:hypothetical protein